MYHWSRLSANFRHAVLLLHYRGSTEIHAARSPRNVDLFVVLTLKPSNNFGGYQPIIKFLVGCLSNFYSNGTKTILARRVKVFMPSNV